MRQKKKDLIPDFIQIPHQLIVDKSLAAADKLVYGAIYFYSKMRGEGCFASNAAIARVIAISESAVANSLKKLEDRHYIIRDFFDGETKARRGEIIPLITMGRLPRSKSGSSNQEPKVVESGSSSQEPTPTSIGSSTQEADTSTQEPRFLNSGTSKNTENKPSDDEVLAQVSQECETDGESGGSSGEEEIESIERIVIEKNNKEVSFSPSEKNELEQIDGRFIDQVEMLKKFKSPEDIPYKLVTESLALFLPLFPNEFVTKNVFAVKPYHTAIKKILMTTGFDDLKIIIEKYNAAKTDKFRPKVEGIFDFCRYKFAAVEAYVAKSAGGLYAQRSISTPEQSKRRDEQYSKIIEQNREKVRKAKEDWAKEHGEN